MPLRAIRESRDVYSFDYDEVSWAKLKAEKPRDLTTACCGEKAVPKTSKLGNRFFSHVKRGNCATAPESAEHIFLKTLIVESARRYGWSATTEKPGISPSGEPWVADVLCEKGTTKVAVEVQWSYQNREDFVRRQRRYAASGIRAAWLYRLKSNAKYWPIDELPSTFELPIFGIQQHKQSQTIFVPQFNVSVDRFVNGLFDGELEWLPKEGQNLEFGLILHGEKCWRCRRSTKYVLGLSVSTERGTRLYFLSFSREGVAQLILKNLGNQHLRQHGVGALKLRYSKTANERYLSNGCMHCDAIAGNFYISQAALNYTNLPDAVGKFALEWRKQIYIPQKWYFAGMPERTLF